MTEWREVSVEEIAAPTPWALATGPFGSAISARFFQDEGVPVLRGSNLSANVGERLILDDLAFVSRSKAAEFRRSIATRGDLVFTSWGTIGQVGLVDERSPYDEYVVSNKQMKLTPDPTKVDPLFLYYLFASPEVSGRIRAQAIGSSVPGFNLSQLRSLVLRTPPLVEQRRIVRTLGALDDKIELNRQMSETLEEIAKAIFRSWFLDFDPVRAKAEGRGPGIPRPLAELFSARFVGSDLGEIPEGWEVGTLGDVALNHRRGIDAERIEPATPYIALEHIPRRSIALSEWSTGDGLRSNKFGFMTGEILFGKLRPYFHKVGVAPVSGVCSTDIVVIGPASWHWFGLVLGHVSSDEFVGYTDAASTGTKMPRTKWSDMASYRIVLPPQPVAEAFTREIRPLVGRILSGIHESKALAAMRDALLPKLISGELRMKDAARLARVAS